MFYRSQIKIILPERGGACLKDRLRRVPGRDGDSARAPREPVHTPDWMTGENWQAWCDSQVEQDEPPDHDEDEPDPDGLPGAWEYNLDQVVAECRRSPRRRPRLPRGLTGWECPAGCSWAWSVAARDNPAPHGRFPGSTWSRAAGFATGMCLDAMPGV